MELVVFEDDGWNLFSPLNTLKHTSLLRWGMKPLLDLLAGSVAGGGKAELWGRAELREVTTATLGTPYNQEHDSEMLLVNSRTRPGKFLSNLASKRTPFVAIAGESMVAARVKLSKIGPGVVTRQIVAKISKQAPKIEAPADVLFQGYWNLVESNGLSIAGQAYHFADTLVLPSTAKLRGPPSNLRIHGSVEVEDYVSFDTRLGPIVVAEEASIESFTRVSGPCYIGPKTEVLTSLIRGGTSIFEGCKIGGEVENSVIMPHTNKSHFGYLGDSYLGEWVNVGAGSTTSNLKNTYGNVRSLVAGKTVDTGMVKLGAAVGDMSKFSVGSQLSAGKKVGTGSHVTGVAVEDIPPFTYFDGNGKKMVELLLDSVLETQRRMKERRGLTLSRAEEELIGFAFRVSASERKRAGVKRGRLH